MAAEPIPSPPWVADSWAVCWEAGSWGPAAIVVRAITLSQVSGARASLAAWAVTGPAFTGAQGVRPSIAGWRVTGPALTGVQGVRTRFVVDS